MTRRSVVNECLQCMAEAQKKKMSHFVCSVSQHGDVECLIDISRTHWAALRRRDYFAEIFLNRSEIWQIWKENAHRYHSRYSSVYNLEQRSLRLAIWHGKNMSTIWVDVQSILWDGRTHSAYGALRRVLMAHLEGCFLYIVDINQFGRVSVTPEWHSYLKKLQIKGFETTKEVYSIFYIVLLIGNSSGFDSLTRWNTEIRQDLGTVLERLLEYWHSL